MPPWSARSRARRVACYCELRRNPLPRTWVNKMVAYLLSVLTGQNLLSSRASNVEVPSLVLIQRVACLVLNSGGDGSRVARPILQRISRGEGGHLSGFVVIDTARS